MKIRPIAFGLTLVVALLCIGDTACAGEMTAEGQTADSVTCCVGKVGNCNNDELDAATIGDIATLVNHLFINKPRLACVAECDADQSGGINPSQETPGSDLTIGDVAELIYHLFYPCGYAGCPPLNDCLTVP